ncbi:MAG: hypothetical protein WCI92_12445 [Bacteroidota bacterium]
MSENKTHIGVPLIKLIEGKNDLKEPYSGKGLLNPDDRITEILTGIIITLTFTCTLSVIKTDNNVVKDMLTGATCSALAWGLIDAVIFLFMTMIDKEHTLTFLNFVRKSKDLVRVHQVIVDDIPSTIADVMKQEEIEIIRKKILLLPDPPPKYKLKFNDYRTAGGIFLLVFFATVPISMPFILMKDMQTALRVSNIIAILMMFLCGMGLGKYAGRNRFVLGILTSLIGIVLVALTILLGG